MTLYFTDVADIVITADVYIHDPMTDRENCACIMCSNVGENMEYWIDADSFEYVRGKILEGKTIFLLDPTEKLHNENEFTPIYNVVVDE